MARIGDKIRTHLLGATILGAVHNLHKHLRFRPQITPLWELQNLSLKDTVLTRKREVHHPLLSITQNLLNGFNKRGCPKQIGKMIALGDSRNKLVGP